jgi:PEP-CTERM motif-containing protein
MHTKTHLRGILVLSLLALPILARADSFTYTFSSDVAKFSFTVPSLLTVDQTILISPVSIQGATFTFASFAVAGGEQCFLFATSNVTGNCNAVSETAPFSLFNASFPNVNGIGTYLSDAFSCSRSDPAMPCVLPNQGTWSLTIAPITVPEPAGLVLMATGVFGILGKIRRRV